MAHQKQIVSGGQPLESAKKVLILIHGRGATAEDILGLGNVLDVNDYALLAPQATNYTWYPQSFLAPVKMNEPWLSSAIALIDSVVNDLVQQGKTHEKIYFAGFSQGACLTLEYITRNARRWGGAAAFTGGLIGDRIYEENYNGDFGGTPIFVGSSDPDPHVPVERVQTSVEILRRMNATVTEKIYPGIGHTIITDEIRLANEAVFSK